MNTHVNFIGTLTAEPNSGKNKNEEDYLHITCSVNTTMKKPNGKGFVKNYHEVTFVDKSVPYLAAHLKKGSRAAVNGTQVFTEYEKDGEKRLVSRIKATDIEIVGFADEEKEATTEEILEKEYEKQEVE